MAVLQAEARMRPARAGVGMPARTLMMVAATLLIGPIVGLAVFLVAAPFTSMAPVLGGIAGAGAQFVAAHWSVHHLGVEPVPFLKTYFAALWGLILAGTLAMLVMKASGGGELSGGMIAGILFGPPILAALLSTVPALAVGDKEPPGR